MVHEGVVDTNSNRWTGNNLQRIVKGTNRLGYKKTSEDRPDSIIIKIGQSSEKSPYLGSFAVTQSSVKNL